MMPLHEEAQSKNRKVVQLPNLDASNRNPIVMDKHPIIREVPTKNLPSLLSPVDTTEKKQREIASKIKHLSPE